MTARDAGFEREFEDARAERRRVEEAIFPLATSLDGREFRFQASLHGLAFTIGGYVEVEADGRSLLGQVLGLEAAERTLPSVRMPIRAAAGEGALLEEGSPFHDAGVRPARAGELARLAAPPLARGRLVVGEHALAPGVPLALDAAGFARHTFLVGQSGSGKTYSLGVLLERLLAETSLKVVVLDPNSDYVGLADSADGGAPPPYADGVEIRSGDALRVRLGDLDTPAQAALLRLDPIADREEYAVFASLVAENRPTALDDLARLDDPGARLLLARIRNLGVDRWPVWARGASSVLDALGPDGPRCLVVDLGSLASRDEQELVAAAVLQSLWSGRARREPVLVVVDEAHNVCPPAPGSELARLATEAAVAIAGEGRKYGLYLLVATQRPAKVHDNVLSQCDNLVLMRMNSRADAALIAELFHFAPGGLVERAPTFRQGEALVAGRFASHAAIARFGTRISREGGSDVPATWASEPPVRRS